MTHLKIGDPWPFRSARGLIGAPCKPIWHALVVAPQQESRRTDQLRNAGVVVRYPTREVTRHINGHPRKFLLPVISQIIYAQFTYLPHWDVMRDRRVITGVFSRDGQPIALTEDDVNAVMGLPSEAERLAQEKLEAERPRVGEKAEIVDGPFAGFFVDVKRVEFGRVWFDMISGLKGDVDQKSIKRVAAE